jgi:hypothetical protein
MIEEGMLRLRQSLPNQINFDDILTALILLFHRQIPVSLGVAHG